MLNSLLKKNFLITFTSLAISFAVSYVIIYNYVPLYYINLQEKHFIENTEKAVEILNNEDEITLESFEKINDVVNMNYYIINSDGKLVFMYDNARNQGIYWENGIKTDTSDIMNSEDYLKEKFIFGHDKDTYQIIFSTPLDSVTGIQEVLHMIVPYMIILGIILSTFTSLFFANYVSKPIIKLNKRAIEIANLDFKKYDPFPRSDEIGILSKNLVIMSNHLEKAMDDLWSDMDQVKQRDQERKELMAILSHELKTPLTVLIGQTECMINDIGKYKDHKKYLRENINEFNRLNNLVNQILVVSKIDNLDYKLEPEKVQIERIIKAKCQEYQNIFNEKDLKYKLSIKQKDIKVDPILIEFILKNLIENAFKYAKEKSVIQINTTPTTIEVTNVLTAPLNKTGEVLKQAFIQNDDSRNSSGHGLGLYIVEKSLAKLQIKSRIDITNEKFSYKIYL